MTSLKSEFREHLMFYEKYFGWLSLTVLFTLMFPLVLPGIFFENVFSESAKYSASLDDVSLILIVFGIFTVLTQISFVSTAFSFACAKYFGLDFSGKIKGLFDFCKIYSSMRKKHTSKDISTAASKLPKDSEFQTKELLKQLAQKNRRIAHLEEENKKLRDKLSDNNH